MKKTGRRFIGLEKQCTKRRAMESTTPATYTLYLLEDRDAARSRRRKCRCQCQLPGKAIATYIVLKPGVVLASVSRKPRCQSNSLLVGSNAVVVFASVLWPEERSLQPRCRRSTNVCWHDPQCKRGDRNAFQKHPSPLWVRPAVSLLRSGPEAASGSIIKGAVANARTRH